MAHIQFDDRYIDNQSQKKNLKGVEDNILNSTFFSKKNITIIQNSIRHGIYTNSNGKYVISDQSKTQLEIIMRSIYLQYSKNLDYNIKEQIVELNKMVVQFCIPKITSNIKQYLNYRDTISQAPQYMEHPKNVSNSGSKTLINNIF